MKSSVFKKKDYIVVTSIAQRSPAVDLLRINTLKPGSSTVPKVLLWFCWLDVVLAVATTLGHCWWREIQAEWIDQFILQRRTWCTCSVFSDVMQIIWKCEKSLVRRVLPQKVNTLSEVVCEWLLLTEHFNNATF